MAADLNALDNSVKGAVNSVVYARRDPSKRGPDAIRGVETGLKPIEDRPLSWTPVESILWASIVAYSPIAGFYFPLGPLPSRPIEWFGEESGRSLPRSEMFPEGGDPECGHCRHWFCVAWLNGEECTCDGSDPADCHLPK